MKDYGYFGNKLFIKHSLDEDWKEFYKDEIYSELKKLQSQIKMLKECVEGSRQIIRRRMLSQKEMNTKFVISLFEEMLGHDLKCRETLKKLEE